MAPESTLPGAPLIDGDNASLAAGLGTTVSLWGQVSECYGARPVWTSRIAPGVSCP